MEICYIELRTGFNDNGPAWIAKVKRSKSKQTIYSNNKAFQKYRGVYANYIDIETGEECWISGVKKDCNNRHWAGSGKILADRSILEEYLSFIEQPTLDPSQYEIVDIPEQCPKQRIYDMENKA